MMNTIPLVYYMPVYLRQNALETDDAALLDFCELFNIVNTNACVIDRTGSLTSPLNLHSLYPVPEQVSTVKDFGTLCIERAAEILDEGMPVYFMYSGGLDSTAMLIAFDHVLNQRGKGFEQLVICTSPDAQSENPAAWHDIVLPNYKLLNTRDMMSDVKLENYRYVQGENADQLFGSDRVFTDAVLLHQPYSSANLRAFLSGHISDSRSQALDRLHAEFLVLASKCPLPIRYMRDFLWWMNFTCKWQSVALRTLSFTNVFEKGAKVPLGHIKRFDTFFNTVPFQQLAISGKLDRWGEEPTAYTYKKAARDFILEKTGWSDYVRTKIKVGSLYNVIRQRKYVANAVGFEDGNLFATEL